MGKELSVKESSLVTIHTNLTSLLVSKASALPKEFNQTRFIQNALAVMQDVPDVEKCEPVAVARALLKGAFLGLDFFNKECYVIIYSGKPHFQTDYKGERKLCKKYSTNPIRDIYAKLVREGDELTIRITGGKQSLDFIPSPFSTAKIIGAFAVVIYVDNTLAYEAMSTQEIEEVRKVYSKAPNSKAWEKSAGEMYKKTVLRRLCKNIDLCFEKAEQDEAFEAGGDLVENYVNRKPEVVNAPDPFVSPGLTGKQKQLSEFLELSPPDLVNKVWTDCNFGERTIDRFTDEQCETAMTAFNALLDRPMEGE